EPDAVAALSRHPELWDIPNAVADLAYEEFHLLGAAGRAPDCEAFCARFAPHQSLVREMIHVHHMLAPQVDTLDEECWSELGEKVGDFRLLRELGRGKFARVYLATEPRAGNRTVVIK